MESVADLTQRARTEYIDKNFKSALRLFKKIFDVEPNNETALFYLAYINELWYAVVVILHY